jgi:nucleoid-associated protein YgaU
MPLEHLTITPEKGQQIKALFNPEKYTISKSLQLAEIGIPGLDSPVVQYVRGQNEKISMELFFDTTDNGMTGNVTDVRSSTQAVYQLMKINQELHAPPRLYLTWGNSKQLTSYGAKNNPWLVLDSITEEFNLFSPDGIPLRAKLNVTFREAWTIDQLIQETNPHSGDRTKLYAVRRRDTLSQIAYAQYGDATAWRPIADANTLANPRLLDPGIVLTIPAITTLQTQTTSTAGSS